MLRTNPIFFKAALVVMAAWAGLQGQTAEGVYSTSLKPLENAVYKFVFSPTTDISADAEIDIVFPPQVNLSRVLHAGSSLVDGGMHVSVSQDTLKIKRDGRGKILAARRPYDLLCAIIINPVDMEREYSFKLLFSHGEANGSELLLNGRISAYQQ